jgi:hypothetical protein
MLTKNEKILLRRRQAALFPAAAVRLLAAGILV